MFDLKSFKKWEKNSIVYREWQGICDIDRVQFREIAESPDTAELTRLSQMGKVGVF